MLKGNGKEYGFVHIKPLENSPLAGQDICILGSSVVYGEASGQEAVGEYLAARLSAKLTKEAVSGTTLVDDGSGSYIQRMQHKIDSRKQFSLFICQLSTNDATAGKPLGEISEGRELKNFDTSTVTGAVEYIICYAKQTWGCPVVFFTESHYDSAQYDAMVGRLRELRDKWDIGILDLWDNADFNNITDGERRLYMADDVHPTKAGYRDWWGPEIEKQLLAFI